MYKFHRTPYLNAMLVFTAYTVITTTSQSGSCVIHTKSPVPLIDAYTTRLPSSYWAYVPTSITDRSSIFSFVSEQHVAQETYDPDGYSIFLNESYSSFLNTYGLEGCTALIPASQAIPTYLGALAAVPTTAAPLTTSVGSSATVTSIAAAASSSTPGHHVHHTQAIILSVVLPTIGLVILLLCFIIIRRYRKKRSHAASAVLPVTASETQIYFDQKAELEDEERRRHELQAGGKVHEMNGQDALFEMPSGSKSRMDLASPHEMQELRGLEPSQELEVPSNV